jgi:tetrahydromethanopterin S-methyltransferase subunit C
MLAAGLVLIGLAGIDYYNLEWAAGLVFGALVSIAALRGARKVRRAPARR